MVSKHGNKIFDTTNVILLKIEEEDFNSFLLDDDIDNDGKYKYRIDDFSKAIINTIPEYVYASYENVTSQNAIDKIREAARSIYKIPEYELSKRAYVDNDKIAIAKIKESGYMNRGEFGELLLHLLLREFKDTIPLVSKVYFKDSSGVPAHGFDAVHISQSDNILWLGESKLYDDGKRGITELLSDLENHFNHDYLNEQFVIIGKALEDNKISQREYWLKKLADTPKLSDKLKMINIPMLCTFSCNEIYSILEKQQNDKAMQIYEMKMRELKSFFEKNNKNHLANNLQVILLLFPVKEKKN